MIISQKIVQQPKKKDRQIKKQQMFNLDEEQTSLKVLATYSYDSLSQVGSLEEVKSEHLNL